MGVFNNRFIMFDGLCFDERVMRMHGRSTTGASVFAISRAQLAAILCRMLMRVRAHAGLVCMNVC